MKIEHGGDILDVTLYTSYYANPTLRTSSALLMGITVGDPRFNKLPITMERILAPKREWLKLSYSSYVERYMELLEGLGVDRIHRAIAQHVTPGTQDIVLLCFEKLEKPGEWCHRRMFAEWWEGATGERILDIAPNGELRIPVTPML